LVGLLMLERPEAVPDGLAGEVGQLAGAGPKALAVLALLGLLDRRRRHRGDVVKVLRRRLDALLA
jgi:hypothetical protein